MVDTSMDDLPAAKLKCEIIDDDKNTRLHYYAARGQTEEFCKEFEDRHTIDAENYLGWTPLMMASRNGHIEMVKALLGLGASPSRKNKFGMSVFMITVSSGKLDLVQLLLQHLLCGGISRRSLQNLLSPLSLAILFRQSDIFQYLLSQKFDVNAVTPYIEVTPLMFAASMEDLPVYEELLKNNADPSSKNQAGLTAANIKDLKSNKGDTQTTQKPLTPAELISASPHMGPLFTPSMAIPSQSAFLQIPNHVPVRKSSNCPTPSPSYFVSVPHLTPINHMGIMPQVFFPADFAQNNFYAVSGSPLLSPFVNSDMLNARIFNQINSFSSPNVQVANNMSPCV